MIPRTDRRPPPGPPPERSRPPRALDKSSGLGAWPELVGHDSAQAVTRHRGRGGQPEAKPNLTRKVMGGAGPAAGGHCGTPSR
jgi:hypothetical protein